MWGRLMWHQITCFETNGAVTERDCRCGVGDDVSVSEPRRLRSNSFRLHVILLVMKNIPAYVLLKATMNARATEDYLHLAFYVCDGKSLVQHIHGNNKTL